VGRCLLEPIVVPKTGEILREAGGYLANDSEVKEVADAGVTHVVARTVMTCHAKHGICESCYGWDLASGRPVDIGTAVGIIAAQSIGEPGTQLTMRTFHTGGVAGEDITHGLPRVTELFEARKPKGQAILAEIAGVLTIEDADKTRQMVINTDDGHEKAYTVSRRARLRPGVANGITVELGQQLTEGSVNPHDLLALKGPNETLRYIVDQVQDVYRSQGVDINDKHIEVISRQMLRKVTMLEPGDTDFLPGALVDRFVFQYANADALASGGEPASGHPVLLGITKASLATDSYLSAASFQETTRVLTDAAIAGKEDQLLGLKENVIIGKLIPAATGMKRYRAVSLTYKGQSVEWDRGTEGGPLPDFAPDELKELEALVPVVPEAGLSDADAVAMFADLDLDEDGEIDVSAFTGAIFDPTVAAAAAEAAEGEEATREGAEDAVPSIDASMLAEALPPADELEDVKLGDLGVSTRWVNKFAEAGISNVADLRGMAESDLLGLPGIGQTAVDEVRAGLDRRGLSVLV
jgi:DNA-directed RNA polymerase subunit beta'